MIPLPFPAGIPWRAIGWAAMVAGVALAGWRVSAWHEAYKAYPALEERIEAEEGCKDGSKCSERQAALEAAHVATNARVVATYEQELADIRGRPARVVRVCPDPSGLLSPAAAGGDHGAGAAGGQLPRSPGPDIGPELYGLARDADEVSARLRACQRWAEAVSRVPD